MITFSESDTEADTTVDDTEATVDDADVELDGSGAVINIYVWNKEFAQRMQAHLPGYEPASDDPEAALDGGTYNGVKVEFNQVDNADNKYQDNLDAALLAQADADADAKTEKAEKSASETAEKAEKKLAKEAKGEGK